MSEIVTWIIGLVIAFAFLRMNKLLADMIKNNRESIRLINQEIDRLQYQINDLEQVTDTSELY